jgi:hypothetical protein
VKNPIATVAAGFTVTVTLEVTAGQAPAGSLLVKVKT